MERIKTKNRRVEAGMRPLADKLYVASKFSYKIMAHKVNGWLMFAKNIMTQHTPAGNNKLKYTGRGFTNPLPYVF